MQADRIVDTSRYDRWLAGIVIGMLSLGMVMVYSATIAGTDNALTTNIKTLSKHLVHILLGVGLAVMVSFIKLPWLQSMSKRLLFVGLLLLGVVFIPGVGVEVNGSTRWIGFGGLRFQPSELVKIAAVIYFADYLSRKNENLHLFKVGILNIGLVVGVIGLLLILEPDFGTTVVIAATAGCMMFLAGARFWHFLLSSGVAVGLMAAILVNAEYRMNRLMSFQDPWADPYQAGFQLSQALIAIGRGEWFGVGLGASIQKLFYLPHAGNDFIVAIIGEELGAVGILLVLILFAMFLFRTFRVADRAFKGGFLFSGLLAQGIGLLFTFQATVHIGVNTGLLPTKGITLPFVSYGGSSIVSGLIGVGILFAIDRQIRSSKRRSQ